MSSVTNYWEPGWRGTLACGTVVVAMSNLELTPAIWANMDKLAGFELQHSMRAVGRWENGRWTRYASLSEWSPASSGAMERRCCDPAFGPLYVSHVPVSCIETSNEFGLVIP